MYERLFACAWIADRFNLTDKDREGHATYCPTINTAFAKTIFPLSQKHLKSGLSTIYTIFPWPFSSTPNTRLLFNFLFTFFPANPSTGFALSLITPTFHPFP